MSHRCQPPILDYQELKAATKAQVRERVLALMKAQKLSKRGLAKKANVPYSVIHTLVMVGIDPRLSTVSRLARGLGVHIRELL